MKTCAVIPAAGRGSRLGGDVPKLLLPVTTTETVWSLLRKKLLNVVDHIHIVVAPQSEQRILDVTQADRHKGFVSISVQPQPIGMGDAIFQGYAVWSQAERIVILWGDQVNISSHTIKTALMMHGTLPQAIVLPLAKMTKPYVDYIFDEKNKLIQVKQSREGEVCRDVGLSDVGTFVLSVKTMLTEWKQYLSQLQQGAETGEINFLPFLPFLVRQGWELQHFQVADATEARGINTMDDLQFFQKLYEAEKV